MRKLIQLAQYRRQVEVDYIQFVDVNQFDEYCPNNLINLKDIHQYSVPLLLLDYVLAYQMHLCIKGNHNTEPQLS